MNLTKGSALKLATISSAICVGACAATDEDMSKLQQISQISGDTLKILTLSEEKLRDARNSDRIRKLVLVILNHNNLTDFDFIRAVSEADCSYEEDTVPLENQKDIGHVSALRCKLALAIDHLDIGVNWYVDRKFENRRLPGNEKYPVAMIYINTGWNTKIDPLDLIFDLRGYVTDETTGQRMGTDAPFSGRWYGANSIKTTSSGSRISVSGVWDDRDRVVEEVKLFQPR